MKPEGLDMEIEKEDSFLSLFSLGLVSLFSLLEKTENVEIQSVVFPLTIFFNS